MIGNILAGMLNKPAPTTDFESIATSTVGSGGTTTITFSSIPSTFQHLQIRSIQKATNTYNQGLSTRIRLGNGSADTGNNYSWHGLGGNGTSVAANNLGTTTNFINMTGTAGDSTGGQLFGGLVIDILDYANSSKYKTVRALGGVDMNGSGSIYLSSGLWMNSAVVDTIALTTEGNFSQYTHFALYGIRG